MPSPGLSPLGVGVRAVPDELKAAIILFFSVLDEQQRRLYAGLESLTLGHGGDRTDRRPLGPGSGHGGQGAAPALVAGRGDGPGAEDGRGAAAPGKKTPEVIARIEALMKHEVAGDPCTGLKWTRRTTQKIARELRAVGIEVSARTVARLLKKLRFSLRVNRKMIGRGSRPDRDEQFQYIARLRDRFAAQHLPIVSIDSKKKEMVGNFKNGGTAWNRTAVLVNDHDFRSEAKGMALPQRHLRRPGEPWDHLRGHLARHARLRGGQPGEMVVHRGTTAVPRRPRTARPRRRRR